jgi:hypothetical protein
VRVCILELDAPPNHLLNIKDGPSLSELPGVVLLPSSTLRCIHKSISTRGHHTTYPRSLPLSLYVSTKRVCCCYLNQFGADSNPIYGVAELIEQVV